MNKNVGDKLALLGRSFDVGRALDPENDSLFTWWAPWRNLKQRNIGWRIDYFFVSDDEFDHLIENGGLLEHATVYGHSYGTLKSEVLGRLRAGQDVLLNVDVQGAATIRARADADPELKRALVGVFLTPPTVAMLEELRNHVAHEIGPIAKPRQILVVPELPKTRSGKIMRRVLKARAQGLPEGDVSTLEE